MSKFSNFLTKLGKWFGLGTSAEELGSILGNHFQSWINSQTGAGLTGAEQAANDFTAQEAHKERAWQENMRATNFQTQVQDMKLAGLNPALMYANGGSSSTPSGASATSVAPNAPASLSDMIQLMMLKANLKKVNAETRNIDANTELTQENVPKVKAETGLLELQKNYYPKVTEAQLSKINAETQKLAAEIPYLGALTKEANAQASLAAAQAVLTKKQSAYYEKIQDSIITLNNAKASEADKNAAKLALEQSIMEFRLDYMKRTGVDVPASGWAGLLAAIGNAGENTFVNGFDILMKSLKDVLQGAFKFEFKNDTHVEIPYSERRDDSYLTIPDNTD